MNKELMDMIEIMKVSPKITKIEVVVDGFSVIISKLNGVISKGLVEIETNKPEEKPNRSEYMKEYMKQYRNRIKPELKGTTKHRVSEGTSWKRYEDKIIILNSIDKAVKLLPHRTRIAIYARRSRINVKKRLKRINNHHNINSSDKRIRMLKIVNGLTAELHKEKPYMDINDIRRESFKIYNEKYK